MIFEMITVSMFSTNCYLLSCQATGEGVIIDPGAEGKAIIEKIKSLKIKVRYILNSHGHIDHIGANGFLKAELSVPIALHSKDLDIYHNPGYGLGLVLKKQPEPEINLTGGDQINFGKETLTVIETPGHTPGGVCFLSGENLFCGDTLFAGSIGRTDLPGGSFSEIMKSIKEKLMVLPPETVVYPGHGPSTTIGDESRSNPFIVSS